MNTLLPKLRALQNDSNLIRTIDERLGEFASFKDRSEDEWFSELCFCILAANAKQKTSAQIQSQINKEGFKTLSQETLTNLIKLNKHRFHNNKAKYIVAARQHVNIKSLLMEMTEKDAREWLVENVKGIGYKEASHFLRNTGAQNLAILDRHILNLMEEHNLIKRPPTLTPEKYKQIERKCAEIASKLRISLARLDLMMWYLKTGEVLK